MKIKKNENSVEIIVPVTKYFMQLFVFGTAAIVMCFVILFTIIKSTINLNIDVPQEFFGLLIFGPIFLNYSLWLLIGKEKMFIEKDSVLYTKTNGILTFRKTYELNKIDKIEIKEKTYKSDSFIDTKREYLKEQQGAFPFWFRMGKIKIQYKNKEITIFNGLNNSEMNEVCKILNSEIGNRNTNK